MLISTMLALSVYNMAGVDWGIFYVFEGEGVLQMYFSGEHPYSNIAAFGFVLVGSLAVLYGLHTAKPSEQAVAICAVASAVGIVYAGDFITLFIFWELLTITTALLILLNRSETSFIMGMRFLLFHLTGGLVLFVGILQHYAAAESLAVQHPEAGMLFFIIGIGCKAAFLPVHLWVAWGYPNASFSSSVVLAGLTTKIGVFAIARIVSPPELLETAGVWGGNANFIIAFIGASMAVFGFSCALLQKDMRKLLSYHIISQVGYMVAGAGMGVIAAEASYSIDGSLLHMVNHMLYKALLFMCAGAVIYTTGTGNLHELHHGDREQDSPVWKSLPLVTAGALVGALAISGVPPFNGYISKYLLKYAVEGVQPMDTMLMIASVGTSISFCKLLYFGYFRAWARVKRSLPVSAIVAIVAVAFLCILFGVNPYLLSDLVPLDSVSGQYFYSTGGMIAALQLVVLGIWIFVLTSGILERGIKPPRWLSIESLVFAPAADYAYRMLCSFGSRLDSSVNNFYLRSGYQFFRFCTFIGKVDSSLDEMYLRGGRAAYNFAEKTRAFDGSIERTYEKTGSTVYRLADRGSNAEKALNQAMEEGGKSVQGMARGGKYLDDVLNTSYEKAGEKARQAASETPTEGGRWNPFQWNIQNLNFDTLLLAVVLGIILLVFFYYGQYYGQ